MPQKTLPLNRCAHRFYENASFVRPGKSDRVTPLGPIGPYNATPGNSFVHGSGKIVGYAPLGLRSCRAEAEESSQPSLPPSVPDSVAYFGRRRPSRRGGSATGEADRSRCV